jgi:glycine/D-amino acid oxidase-like deaminating enzyme
MGVATALELAARGWSVTVVEPGPLPRPEAASTDISKIVRMDYGVDELSTEMMEEAIPRWRAWSARWGGGLFHEDGFLLLSRAPLAKGAFEGDSLDTLTRRGHRLERLDAAAIARRFPAWARGGYVDGYLNPVAGWIESGRALSRMIDDARAAGVVFLDGRDDGGSDADARVVAAGAWTPKLLPHLAGALWAVAQPVFHLLPRDPEAWRPPAFTVWAADIASTGWYGFPANADGIVKIAHHGPGRRVDPDAPRTTTAEEVERLRAFLGESLPGLASAPLAHAKTCLYCDSFDGDFWIGADAAFPGRFVVAGDSGHGFKFAPVIGAVVADVVEGKPNRFAARFAPRALAGRRAEDARFGLS